MAAAGTSTALTASAICFLLTFGSCFAIPTIGDEMGLFSGYDVLMPMMLGAFVFAPLGCLFLLGGLVGSLFPSKDEEFEEDKEQNDKPGNAILFFTIFVGFWVIFFLLFIPL